ncbi:hypothetical protein TWF970_004239 [Orbilia oligospora]|uniref:Uncharacterized protein n=1 Tax=Orbilia oligospora TaxID=2813651 RepID=A0A7C8R8D0_ORBOL|nr:hypothetical protein TWF970_004239 [Orbilia oligospora]
MSATENQEFISGGGVRWILTGEERASITSALGIEAHIIDHVRGNVMTRERSVCSGCGKHSGLDDLVHNAIMAGVHDGAFILKVLVDGPQSRSPTHGLQCSHCSENFDGVYDWHYIPVGHEKDH